MYFLIHIFNYIFKVIFRLNIIEYYKIDIMKVYNYFPCTKYRDIYVYIYLYGDDTLYNKVLYFINFLRYKLVIFIIIFIFLF